MPIREKGYYKWEGELKSSGFKWLPIFLHGIKEVFKKKKSRLLFSFNALPFLFFLGLIFFLSKPELKMFQNALKDIATDAFLFKSFFVEGNIVFLIVFLALFAGAHQIANDLKFKSITLYFSRPLSKWDYIKGKFSIILFYLLLFTLVPGILLIIFKIIFSGGFTISAKVVLATFIYPIVQAFFWGSLILMLSSFTTNVKLVIILFVGIFFISLSIAEIFASVLKNQFFHLLSIPANLSQFASFLFGTKYSYAVPGWISGMTLIGLSILFTLVLRIRINKAEV